MENKKAPPMNSPWSVVLGVVIFYLVVTAISATIKDKKTDQISFSQFIQEVKSKKVVSLTIEGDHDFKAVINDTATGVKRNVQTIGDARSDFYIKTLSDNGVTPDYLTTPPPSQLLLFLMSWGPLIFIMGFLWLKVMPSLKNGMATTRGIGKLRNNVFDITRPNVTFNDVAGIDEAKEELSEIVEFLKSPEKFATLGGRVPKGALIIGPSGTGKTLLARAIAGEAGVPFGSISGSDFVEMFVGVGASKVRNLFEQAKKNAPCIIFIDEIDSVGRHRGNGSNNGGNDEREQTLNQLLVEMDGFEENTGIIVLAATNRPDVLDPALLRPGRFDRKIVVDLPDVKGREQILKTHAKKVLLGKMVDLSKVAKGTSGFSGADLASLINEAAILASRAGKKEIEFSDIDRAKDKILMGVERKSLVIGLEDKKITAYHEAGHTLITKKIKGLDPIHKVSIIPRGRALGVTMTVPEENMLNLTKEKALNMIVMFMGGRVAEELVFNHYTTGASNDIERATNLARKMVCEWGMSEKLGPMTFAEVNNPKMGEAMMYSNDTRNIIESEVKQIIADSYKRAQDCISLHRDKLEKIALALLEKETLDSNEVEELMNS